jgi:hypothetical protein
MAVLSFCYHEAARTPLGDGPVLTFPHSKIPSSAERQFLASDFTIIKDVKALPRPVLQAFTEEGGSRFTLANPGKEFLATDVIDDSSLPRKRLIFAGISGEKCFVHYEQGGIGHSFVLAFFRVTSNDKMEPVTIDLKSWQTPLSEKWVLNLTPVMKELPNGIPDNKRPGHEEQDSIEYARMLFRPSSLSAAS